MKPPIFVKPVGLIEQRRDFLDLVDDDLSHLRLGCNLGAEQLGAFHVATKLFRLQQVQPERIRVCSF